MTGLLEFLTLRGVDTKLTATCQLQCRFSAAASALGLVVVSAGEFPPL